MINKLIDHLVTVLNNMPLLNESLETQSDAYVIIQSIAFIVTCEEDVSQCNLS